MKGRATAAIFAVSAMAFASSARADDDSDLRCAVGASFAYSAPAGDAERGARLADTAYAAAPFAFDVGCPIAARLELVIDVSYAVTVPTVCAGSSECIASAGRDVAANAGLRYQLPRVGPTSPRVAYAFGYEWLATHVVDGNATSTRAYRGPIFGLVALDAPLRLAERWAFVPFASGELGVYSARELHASGLTQSSSIDDRTSHLWLTLGARLELDL